MTIINPNSISGISSITALNSTAAINLFKADGTSANIIAGVITATTFKGALEVTSASFSSNIDANGDLDVDGHTNLDNVNVSGASTFTGAITAHDFRSGGGVGNTLYLTSADDWRFRGTGGSEKLRITNTGKVLIGHDTNIFNYKLAVFGTDGGQSGIAASRFSNNTSPSSLILSKSRGTSIGSYTIVQNNDEVGMIDFRGADGSDNMSKVAEIKASIDGTPGSNDMPGRLQFHTTADGASTTTERLRITSAGVIETKTRSAEVRRMILSGSPSNSAFNIEAHDGETGTSSGDVQGKLGLFYNDGSTLTNTSCISFIRGSGAPDGAMAFVTNQTERVRIESGGDVDIKSGVIKLGSGANRRLMYRSGNNDVILEADSGDFYRQDIANSTHEFFTGNTAKLVILSDGKVGINSTVPTKDLDIYGNIQASILYLNRHGSPTINLTSTSDTGGGAIYFGSPASGIRGGILYDHNNDQLKFRNIYGNSILIDNSRKSTFYGDIHGVHDGLAVNIFESNDNHSRLRIRSGETSLAQLEFANQSDADAGEIRYDHANDRMTIHVGNNVERVRIDSSGNIELTGNIVLSNAASGRGIDFSASANASNASASMSSELFDDYEEGTFTPTDVSGHGITITNNNPAQYTKIGRFVHVTFDCTWASGHSGGGNAAISLPFLMGEEYGSGSVGWNQVNKPLQVHVNSAGAQIMENYSNGTGSRHLSNNDASGNRIIGDCSYFTGT